MFNQVIDQIFYFDGGGIQGSNELRNVEQLIIIGTPNKNEKVYIEAYHDLFGEWPETNIEGGLEAERIVEQNQLIGYEDPKMDLIHKLEVRNPLIDNLHRIRGLRTSSKELTTVSPPYEELEQYAEGERLPEYIVDKLDEEGYQLEHGDTVEERAELWELSREVVEDLADAQGKKVAPQSSDQEPNRIIDPKEATKDRIREDIKQYLKREGETSMTELKQNIRGDDGTIIQVIGESTEFKVSPVQEFGGSKIVQLE